MLKQKGERGVERVLRVEDGDRHSQGLRAASAMPGNCTILRAGERPRVLVWRVTYSDLCFMKITGNSVQKRLHSNKAGKLAGHLDCCSNPR